MATSQIVRELRVSFEDDGSVRAIKGDLWQITTDEAGKLVDQKHIGTKKSFSEAELATTLPQSTLSAQINTLQNTRDTLTTERDALKAERDDLKVERDTLKPVADTVPALTTERDAVKAERDALKTERDQLGGQIAEKTTAIDTLNATNAATVQALKDQIITLMVFRSSERKPY